MTTTRIQLLGWIDHWENEHPAVGTIIPVWLCSMEALNEAIAEGFVREVGRQSLIPRWGYSTIIYGLTDKGRDEFLASIPLAKSEG